MKWSIECVTGENGIISQEKIETDGVLTGQNQTNFNEFLKFGEEGEEIVAEYLMDKCDVSILPLYQFGSESTPIILKKKIKMITPDLTCFNSGHVFFC